MILNGMKASEVKALNLQDRFVEIDLAGKKELEIWSNGRQKSLIEKTVVGSQTEYKRLAVSSVITTAEIEKADIILILKTLKGISNKLQELIK